MTTIAYRDGVLATDSGVYSGEVELGSTKKIHKIADECYIAVCGDADSYWLIVSYIKSIHCKKSLLEWDWSESPKTDSSCILVNRGKVYHLDAANQPYVIKAAFYADGCGYEFAFGAMEMGASAIEAVEVAIKYHALSSGKVRSVNLRKKEMKDG